MWTVKQINLNNFLSHEDSTISIEQGNTYQIVGENLDVTPISSNGSGKSCLIEGLYFGLTGTIIRKIKNKEIHKNGTKNSQVSITLYNTRTKQELLIERKVTSGSQKVLIYEDGELNKELKDLHPQKSTDYILLKLGLSKEELSSYYFVNRLNYQSFILGTPKTRLDIINKLIQSSKLDSLIEEYTKYHKEHTKQQQEIETKKQILEGKVVEIQSQIEQLKESGKLEYEEELKQLNSQIESNKSQLSSDDEIEELKKEKLELSKDNEIYAKDIEKNKKIISLLTKELHTYEQKGKELKKTYLQTKEELSTILSKKKEEKKQIEDTLLEFKKQQQELQLVLKGVIRCPNCLEEFFLDKNITPQEANILLQDIENSILQLNQTLVSIEQQLQEVELLLEEVKREEEEELNAYREKYRQTQDKILNEKSTIQDFELKIQSNNSKFKTIDDRINYLRSQRQLILNKIEELSNKLKELKKEGIPNKFTKLIEENEKNIKLYTKEIKEVEKQSNNLIEEIEFDKFTIQTIKDFRIYTSKKVLEFLELSVNRWLRDFGSEFQISINGFKTLASGEVRDQIDVQVFRGTQSESVGKFSNGEIGRLELAFILSLQDLFNETSNSGGLDLLCVDELLDGVDENGMLRLIDELSQTQRTILLISHVGISNSGKIIKFIKKNQTTKLERND